MNFMWTNLWTLTSSLSSYLLIRKSIFINLSQFTWKTLVSEYDNWNVKAEVLILDAKSRNSVRHSPLLRANKFGEWSPYRLRFKFLPITSLFQHDIFSISHITLKINVLQKPNSLIFTICLNVMILEFSPWESVIA